MTALDELAGYQNDITAAIARAEAQPDSVKLDRARSIAAALENELAELLDRTYAAATVLQEMGCTCPDPHDLCPRCQALAYLQVPGTTAHTARFAEIPF